MNYEEFLQKAKPAALRKKPGNEEHRIQCACVRWFRLQHPKLRNLLFAVPNGGRRDAATGSILKDEGVTAGVADLILLKANRYYGALAIEMKTPKAKNKKGGEQSDSQKAWQRECEAAGNKYAVCRSLDEFIQVVSQYLQDQ